MQVWPGVRWERADPPDAVDLAAVRCAVTRHEQRATLGVRDMKTYLDGILAEQPFREILGPLKDAAGPSGVCIHRGRLLAQWGDPAVVEMAYSMTKTYLSVVAGVAFHQGLLRDVDDPVAQTVQHRAFTGPRHAAITWRHLLQQTSEWGGELWGVPWWGDPQGGQPRDHVLAEPGTVWAYNDVRINLLALALLHVFGRPLPNVLATEVMGPIGASSTWEWHGYRNSSEVVHGERLVSVSGGAHWGGGLWANAFDHARVGLLYLRGGRWGDHRILSADWIAQSWAPCDLKPDYGLLWWRNDLRTVFPQAPPSGRCARGNGGRQLLWVDPPRDLVVVSRWSDGVGEFLGELSAGIPLAA